jgi:hypothetical protein
MELIELRGQVYICQNPSCRREFSEPPSARVSQTPNSKCIFCGSNTKKPYFKPILTVYGKTLPNRLE